MSKHRLELSSRDMKCKEVRDAIVSFIVPKRDSIGQGRIPVYISNHEDEHPAS